MTALNWLYRQFKYITAATAMFALMLAVGGLTHQWLADVLGVSPALVVVVFVIAWYLGMHQYNNHLNSTARTKSDA